MMCNQHIEYTSTVINHLSCKNNNLCGYSFLIQLISVNFKQRIQYPALSGALPSGKSFILRCICFRGYINLHYIKLSNVHNKNFCLQLSILIKFFICSISRRFLVLYLLLIVIQISNLKQYYCN